MKKKLKVSDYIIEPDNQFPITKKDTSPIIPQRSKFKGELHVLSRPDLTEKQKQLIDIISNKQTKMVIVSGPAGTAKTYSSLLAGLTLLSQKKVSDILYVRSIVESTDNKIGFLPGEINSKIDPYMEPLHDKLSELLPKSEIDLLKKEQRVSAIPISFLRGLNFNAKFVFSDETQNMTFKELITLSTRIGEYSKLILCGDDMQSDINGKSGFTKFTSVFNDDESKENGIYTFYFTEEDIVRSQLVKFIVNKLKKVT